MMARAKVGTGHSTPDENNPVLSVIKMMERTTAGLQDSALAELPWYKEGRQGAGKLNLHTTWAKDVEPRPLKHIKFKAMSSKQSAPAPAPTLKRESSISRQDATTKRRPRKNPYKNKGLRMQQLRMMGNTSQSLLKVTASNLARNAGGLAPPQANSPQASPASTRRSNLTVSHASPASTRRAGAAGMLSPDDATSVTGSHAISDGSRSSWSLMQNLDLKNIRAQIRRDRKQLRDGAEEAQAVQAKEFSTRTWWSFQLYLSVVVLLVVVAGSLGVSFLARSLAQTEQSAFEVSSAQQSSLAVREMVRVTLASFVSKTLEVHTDFRTKVLDLSDPNDPELLKAAEIMVAVTSTPSYNSSALLYVANDDQIFIGSRPVGAVNEVFIRRDDAKLVIRIGDSSQIGSNSEFTLGPPTVLVEGYYPKQRAWWTLAEEKGSGFTPPYVFAGENRLGITYAAAIRDEVTNAMLGAACFDSYLDEFQELIAGLASNRGSASGVVYVFDLTSRALLGSSDRGQPVVAPNGQDPVLPSDAKQPLIRESYLALLREAEGSKIEALQNQEGIDVTLQLQSGSDIISVNAHSVGAGDGVALWAVVDSRSSASTARAMSDLFSVHIIVITISCAVVLVIAAVEGTRITESVNAVIALLNDRNPHVSAKNTGYKRAIFTEFADVHEPIVKMNRISRGIRRLALDGCNWALEKHAQLGQLGLEPRYLSVVKVIAFDDVFHGNLLEVINERSVALNGIFDTAQSTNRSVMITFGALTDNDTHLVDSLTLAQDLYRSVRDRGMVVILLASGSAFSGNIGGSHDMRHTTLGSELDSLWQLEQTVIAPRLQSADIADDKVETTVYCTPQYAEELEPLQKMVDVPFTLAKNEHEPTEVLFKPVRRMKSTPSLGDSLPG